MPDNLSDQQRQEIDDLIFAGQKIQAIKALREAASCDLVTAKQVVEARESQLRESSPDKFAARKGCMTTILLVLTIIASLTAFLS